MSGPLFRFLLWRHRIAFAGTWLVPILVAIAVGLIYPTYAAEREAMSRLLRIAGKFFGNDVIDLLSPVGFLLLPFQHPLTLLMLAIASAVAPLGVAADRGRGFLDLLLSTPLERRSVARSALAVILALGVTFGWAPFLGVWAAAHLSGYAAEIPFDKCAIVALNAGALVVALGCVALACAASAADGASATARFVAFVVVTLAVDVVARFWKSGQWLRWTSLLGYYHPHDVVAGRMSPTLAIGVLLGVAALVYAASEWRFVTRRQA